MGDFTDIAVTSITNDTAVQAGTASNGDRLAAAATPYRRAVAHAYKSATANTVPTNNTGVVYIGAVATGDNVRYSVPLAPGASWELPPNSDLYEYYLFVATANDGVVIFYETMND